MTATAGPPGVEAAGIEHQSINAMRFLAVDAVERAGSGHPGTPMAIAPIMYVLYREWLHHSPEHPRWPDRDRFVLSAGHACLAQYAALHLTGYHLDRSDLMEFRQWGSRTPGHPELEAATPGIEVTTGPLGQGLGNAVGFALAERMLAARFNRPQFNIVDHRTFVVCSDGDLMEGVASEASSLAGHLQLGRLCVIFDDNRITIEGSTDLAVSDDIAGRYRSYGWDVRQLHDGWGLDDLRCELNRADVDPRPSIVIVRTHIAAGAPNAQDSPKAHGAPLGGDEVAATKRALGWHYDEPFTVPEGVLDHMNCRARGDRLVAEWEERRADYAATYPREAAEFDRCLNGDLPVAWRPALAQRGRVIERAAEPTRVSSGRFLATLADLLPELVGGAADLGPSTNTTIGGASSIGPGNYVGRNLHFGVREHAMGAVINGIAAHGGLRPFGATFLVFSDYMRPAVRLASIMGLPVIFVWTHDSVALGEDGPTHQPVEQLAALRAMPGLRVVRPADATETEAAWAYACERSEGPTALILSRQSVPSLGVETSFRGLKRGAYPVTATHEGARIDALIVATGAEVHTAMEASSILENDGLIVRVVSMPCVELFLEQAAEYQELVLPSAVSRRVCVEAAASFGWDRIAGPGGTVIGIDRFGASAPGTTVLERLGITPNAVADAVKRLCFADERLGR